MADERAIRLHIDGDIEIGQFAEAVGAFSTMLTCVTSAIPKASPLSWRTAVRDGSLEIIATPESGDASAAKATTHAIIDGLRRIAERSERPAYFDDDALKSARELAKLRRNGDGTSSDAAITIIHAEHTESLDIEIVDHVTVVLDRKERAHGSVEGTLKMVSTVRALNCALYDRLNDKRIECRFPETLRHQVFVAAEEARRVEATGDIRYSEDGYPEYIAVEELYVFPDPDKLPSFRDVKGILKDDWVPPDERR